MALSGKSIDAATAPVVGDAIVFDKPRSPISMQIFATGDPSGGTVFLELSLDGVNFTRGLSVSFGGQLIGAVDIPAVAARANLISLSGGTSPEATVWIAAGD